MTTYEVIGCPSTFDEFVERVWAGIVPTFQRLPGFASRWCTHMSRNAAASISVRESRASADAATGAASEWARNNITDLAAIRDEFVGDLIMLP